MEKTIVIPTDLKVESLNLLKHALANTTEKVHVILLYAENISNSIQDLLFYSSAKIIAKSSSPAFHEGLAIVKNRYETLIGSIRIEVLHSDSLHVFKRFAEANNITQAIIPRHYDLAKGKNSFNIISIIKKSGVLYTEITWETKASLPDAGSIDLLFQT